MLPTVNVRCQVYDQSGQDVAGAFVSARLSAVGINEGYVLPKTVSGTTDATGVVTLALWPNEMDSVPSHYIVRITYPGTGKTILLNAVVPNMDCDLHSITTIL